MKPDFYKIVDNGGIPATQYRVKELRYKDLERLFNKKLFEKRMAVVFYTIESYRLALEMIQS